MPERTLEELWPDSPLGPPGDWPRSLRTSLDIMQGIGFPACLIWGTERVLLFNDAFAALLPAGFRPGRAFPAAWPPAWHEAAEAVLAGLSGVPGRVEALPLLLDRAGTLVETRWTLAHAPVHDQAGVAGVLCILQETTSQLRPAGPQALLRTAVDELRGAADLSGIGRIMVPLLGPRLRADRVTYGTVDGAGQILLAAAWPSRPEPVPGSAARHALGDLGPAILAELRAGRIVAIADRLADPRLSEGGQAVLDRAGAALLAPVLAGGHLVALLQAQQATPRPWERDDLALLQLAAWLAGGIATGQRAATDGPEGTATFHHVANAVPAFLWVANPAGAITYVNEQWLTYTGQTPEQAMPDGWQEALHPEDRDQTLATFVAALRQGTRYECEQRFRARDGSYRWFMSRAEPLRDQADHITGWIGVATDMHACREAEEALRNSEERFRQFAEHSTDVLWMLDAETLRAEYFSPAFERVWGRSRDSFADNARDCWLETVHPDDRPRAADAMERVRRGEVVVEEYRIMRPDGSVHRIRDTFFPILDAASRVRRVAGIAKDVTRHEGSLVYVVDGEPDMQAWVAGVLQGAGYQVTTFATVSGFLEAAAALQPGCVVLDVSHPEIGGLDVPREVRARSLALPVVAISVYEDMGLAVRAMKAGSVDFLKVPCAAAQLLAAVSTAMAEIRGVEQRDHAAELARARIAAMLPREREVLDLLLAGGTNKTIARDLGISPRTVEFYRARVMERLGARTLPQAVLAAAAAGLRPPAAPES